MNDALTATHRSLRAAQIAMTLAWKSKDPARINRARTELMLARAAHAATRRDPYSTGRASVTESKGVH